MSNSQYYDQSTFSKILKGNHIVKRISDGEDISYSTSSIIYMYDPDWTPLLDKNDPYWIIPTNNMDERLLKNRIMSISGEIITTATGKNVDVSLNLYDINGNYAVQEISKDISGVPFIGNYSIQYIHDTSMSVLDLFTYKPIGYTSTTTNITPNITYQLTYNDFLKAYMSIPPSDFLKISYDDAIGNWYISDPLSDPLVIVSEPTTVYGYTRLSEYTYPTSNVNNIFTNRSYYDNDLDVMIINDITSKISIP